MANSKYEYVKTFELDDRLLPSTWVVVRIDGRGFHRFAEAHSFEKPNDASALGLMNDSAIVVMSELPEIVLAYGVSDEFSFVFDKNCTLFQRRSSKLISVVVSHFASAYVFKWAECFPDKKLLYPPAFDGRAVCYPSYSILRDYLAWRQVDCHINNQYNTCYWNLVNAGLSPSKAYGQLEGTQADYKNELLFQTFHINYSTLPEIFRKGSVIFRKEVEGARKKQLVVEHCDIIGDKFWNEHSSLFQIGRDETKRKSSVTKKIVAAVVS